MRIAIVNDTAMVAEAQRRVVVGTGLHEVVWIARDGAEAVEYCRTNRPDLVLMDIEMPIMDGVEATRQIMADTPCAILVVTDSLESRAGKVFDCLGAGALDALKLAPFGSGLEEGGSPLLAKIKILSRLIEITDAPARSLDSLGEAERCRHLVLIGASAGGPDALATILEDLPTNFPAGIIIIQHIDLKFVGSFASWLGQRSKLPIRLARHGDVPMAGTVYLADSSDHLRFITPTKLSYTREPEDVCYRPSIDVLFESAAHCWKQQVTGVLLTGMGQDGARGLKALYDNGAVTIAQSAASSVVYGMPKAAVALGGAREVLPLRSIAGRLTELAQVTARTPEVTR